MRFIKAFAMSFILIVIIMTFGGALLFENAWGLMVIAALVIAILATTFMSMSDEIGALRKRVDALEGAEKPQEEGEGQEPLAEEETK